MAQIGPLVHRKIEVSRIWKSLQVTSIGLKFRSLSSPGTAGARKVRSFYTCVSFTQRYMPERRI